MRLNRPFPLFLLARIGGFATAAALGMAFFGCGGGGGGGGSSANLEYQTDWTNRGRGVTGQSQRVSLFDSQERLVDTKIVNQDVGGLQSIDLDPDAPGTHRLYVELYSLRDLGGVKTGELESFVTIGSSSSFRSAVGEDPTSVGVTPASATLQVQHSRKFCATALNGPGRAVFSEPDGFTWSTLGGTASVNGTGLVLGLSQGPGTVRAMHDATGLLGSAIFTVDPFQTTTGKWTVIVFLNAANDLFPFSTLNMNQMEAVAQNPDVRFVVQWKQTQAIFPSSTFDGTRRYLVKPDTTGSIASELVQDMGAGIDMGSPTTMSDFISWAKTFYPAQRYVLVVWNHGNGWRRGTEETLPTRAFSYDDETGNAIQTWQLEQAIGNHVFEMLAWDASLMQMQEVAYEGRNRALLVVGSEESPPGEGYPYDLIFARFRDNPDDTTVNLSKSFVDGMLAVPAYQTRRITQSVLDTSKLSALATATDALALQLIANAGSISGQIPTIRAQAQSYSPTSSRVYRDLYHLCLLIEAQIGFPAPLIAAAAQLRSAIDDAVVWEGHNSNSPNSHGIAIDFSSATTFNQGTTAADYGLLQFAQATAWNEWLTIAP